jgi:hypothetical protein
MKKQLLLNALGVAALSLVCACGSQTEAPKTDKEVPGQEEKKGTEVAVNTEAPVTAPVDGAAQVAQTAQVPASTEATQQTAQAPTAPTTEQKA